MSDELLGTMYDQLCEYAELSHKRNINILWHGGEPTLMGKDFFREAWNPATGQGNLAVRHLIQSNLLSIDEEWIDLFIRHNVNVSTSVDPFDNNSRIKKDGSPQFNDWFQNFRLVVEKNVKIGIVFTVTARHLDMIDDIYYFFKNIQSFSRYNVGLKINPVYPSGKAGEMAASDYLVKPHDFAYFILGMWKLMQRDNKPYPISPARKLPGSQHVSCEYSGECHKHFLCIDGKGDVFHCGRFSDGGTPLGNILESSLSSILDNNPLIRSLEMRQEHLLGGHCKGCAFWQYCRGGCPYIAELVNKDILSESPFCESAKILFGSITSDINPGTREILSV